MYAIRDRLLAFAVVTLLIGVAWTQNKSGASCTLPNGSKGRCVPVLNCSVAIQELRFFVKPTQCGYAGKTLLICCKPSIRDLALEDNNCGFTSKTGLEIPPGEELGFCMYKTNCTDNGSIEKYNLLPSHCGHVATNDMDCCHHKSIMIHDDKCLLENDQIGRCAFIDNCPVAQINLANGILPRVCGFVGLRPVVCCPELERRLTIGDNCTTKEGEKGRCIFLETCTKAVEDLSANKTPSNCGFNLRRPVVCCPEPLIRNLIGVKSRQKCLEYHLRESIRVRPAVIGGEEAQVEEFPHMATIGFQEGENITWHCGGTLISDRYVMTAAHCLYSQEFGSPTVIRVGDYNLHSTDDDARPQEFKIAKSHRHPLYKSSSKYHDIALLELSHPVNMFVEAEYIRPACLHTEKELPKAAIPVATGWGLTDFAGNASDVLVKVQLRIYSTRECNRSYANNFNRRGLLEGILDDGMICAGGAPGEIKDTCQGDSGGPLQVFHPQYSRSYLVIGITSFGKGCGVANSPGVYTRVSNYISWIESIIWPSPA